MISLLPSRTLWSVLCLALVSTGFAAEPEWIWKGPQAQKNQSVFFRKTFTLPEKPQQAHLWAAADVMVIYVNGEKLTIQRGWENLYYEDIASRLDKGSNLIAIEGFNGGDLDAGLLFQLSASINGATAAIVSDESWKIATSVPGNWKSPACDDSGWGNPTSFGALGQGARAKVDRDSLLIAAGIKQIPAATVAINPLPKPEPTPQPKPVVEVESKPETTPPTEKKPVQAQPATETTSEPYAAKHPFGDQATPAGQIRVMPGFQVERLYSVPKEQQGSWVAMCSDDQGRLITSDQFGGLYRMTPPQPGQSLKSEDVTRIELEIGHAQGLLYAFDSLYVIVNSDEFGGRGLYRVRDIDGDDRFDLVENLKVFENIGGEHGPHSVVLGPDGASLYVCVGNETPVPEWHRTRIQDAWQDDLLLDRPKGKQFMDHATAPGGWIAKTDPEGNKWEIVATGLRNDFDAAFRRDGELFAFDSDMEWDLGTPWYRPTRIYHVVSGAEFGWRGGGGKWPSYYFDSVPPVLEVGTGAPTGITFGYGATFPAKYQEALFACDWSHGRIYAIHPRPQDGSYRAKFEEFLSAHPLPLTDILVHEDGALYFTIGGRNTQSGLYRVSYVGTDSTEPETPQSNEFPVAFQLRKALEQFHGHAIPGTVDTAWPYLIHPDRSVRFAARTVLEHQPIETWMKRALREVHPRAKIESLMALVRLGSPETQTDIIDSLDALYWENLDETEKVDLARVYAVLFSRMGPPPAHFRDQLVAKWAARFPAKSTALDTEMLELLVFLQAEEVAKSAIERLELATSQEEQIGYAKSLCHLKVGWTPELRSRFLNWFLQAQDFKGGASLPDYLSNMREMALSLLSEEEKQELSALLSDDPVNKLAFASHAQRSFVKSWTIHDFDQNLSTRLRNAHLENGRRLFSAASCQSCHSFGPEGRAIGPDLKDLTSRFGAKDILDHILNPSGHISSQYSSVMITKKDQSTIIGQIVDQEGEKLFVNTEMQDPTRLEGIDRNEVAAIQPSPVSMMPPGLLDSFNETEVMDLLGFLVYGGRSDSDLAQK